MTTLSVRTVASEATMGRMEQLKKSSLNLGEEGRPRKDGAVFFLQKLGRKSAAGK